jgi:hypothetical protein
MDAAQPNTNLFVVSTNLFVILRKPKSGRILFVIFAALVCIPKRTAPPLEMESASADGSPSWNSIQILAFIRAHSRP